jgi:tRNA threonylcarbamoyl adenosine modification protein (Sua5/YciO/YrdC/YwlC family)
MVLPATREVPRQLFDAKRRRIIGIRVPAHPVTRALVTELGRPLLTSSAVPNDGDEACVDADELIDAFGRHLDLLVDSGTLHGEPSTVISIEGDEVVIIRQGAGSLDGVI